MSHQREWPYLIHNIPQPFLKRHLFKKGKNRTSASLRHLDRPDDLLAPDRRRRHLRLGRGREQGPGQRARKNLLEADLRVGHEPTVVQNHEADPGIRKFIELCQQEDRR